MMGDVARAVKKSLDTVFTLTIRRAHEFCPGLPKAPGNFAELNAYFETHRASIEPLMNVVETGPATPLFPPRTMPDGSISWDSVDSLSSRYVRSDMQIRSSETSEDWQSLYTMLVVYTGGSIEIRCCETPGLQHCLDQIREAVRKARKTAPAA